MFPTTLQKAEVLDAAKNNFLPELGEFLFYYESKRGYSDDVIRLKPADVDRKKIEKLLQNVSDTHNEVIKKGREKFPDVHTPAKGSRNVSGKMLWMKPGDDQRKEIRNAPSRPFFV